MTFKSLFQSKPVCDFTIPWDPAHKHSLYSPSHRERGLQEITQLQSQRLVPSRCCRSCGPALSHSVSASWSKSSRGYVRRGSSHNPPYDPNPLILWKRVQRLIHKAFYFSTCKREETCNEVWLAFHILLPHTITNSAHISHRREQHESHC